MDDNVKYLSVGKNRDTEYMKHFWLFLKPYKKPLSTVRDNLLFANPERTEDEIKPACIMANIYDMIMALPDKFATITGE